MTPRELISQVQHLIEVAGVDPDKEIFITNNTEGIYIGPQIAKIDWLWENPVDENDYAKVLNIILEVK